MHQLSTLPHPGDLSPHQSSSETPANEALRAKQLELANEVARVLSTALMTFLSLCVYVGIIVASTTDEMLVKATTVTLPFFNVPISIVGFYALAPLLVVLHHGYVIVYFEALAQKLQRFRDGIVALPLKERAVYYERLVTLPYVQFLACPDKASTGGWLSVYLPLGIVPVLVTVWLQYRLIVYRDMWPATVLQALAVVAQAGLLFWWLPKILRQHLNDPALSKRGVKIFIFVFLGVLGVLIAGVLLWLRFAPGTAPWGNPGVLELRGVTLTQNTLSPEVFSQLKNDAQQDQALQHISTFYLQGKDLRGATLYEAVLPKIDLRAKTVSGLYDLLGCSSRVPGNQQEQDIIRCRSRLDGVDFRWAYLQQAWLDEASLIDAKLDHARLRGAVLSGALLKNATLQGARAAGASFSKADLRGADLRGADLSHTNFMCANLAGAKLEGANLQQANFKGARCAGATFDPTFDMTRCARLDRVSSPDDNAFCRQETGHSSLTRLAFATAAGTGCRTHTQTGNYHSQYGSDSDWLF